MSRRLLLKAGVLLKGVSERLGHSSPAFTMTTYQHVLPGMQADAAGTFADLLNKAAWRDGRRRPGGPRVRHVARRSVCRRQASRRA